MVVEDTAYELLRLYSVNTIPGPCGYLLRVLPDLSSGSCYKTPNILTAKFSNRWIVLCYS
jgi:hypothetical protein